MLPRDRQVRIKDMVEALESIERYTHGLTPEVFMASQIVADAVMYNLSVIGEAARHVPQEIQARYPDIPWTEMRGIRNVLAHNTSV